MSQQVTLKASRISKNFPGVKALQDVEIELHAGSIHALLGENGAGKSPLIKNLTGVYQPDEGSVNSLNSILDEFENISSNVSNEEPSKSKTQVMSMKLKKKLGF